jgi:hypothetical protein
MDNQNVVEQKAVETETIQSNSPQDREPITGAETIQEETVQPSVVEDSSEPAGMNEEQRRAFQEQRLEIKRLREERETKPREESAFNAFRAQTPPAQSAPVRIEQYADPITGETNWQAYNAALQQREQNISQQARFEARSEVQEVLDEERARTKFPDLMSNPVTEKQIASRWLYEKIQGRNVSITDIAGEFARNFRHAVSKAEKVGAERILNEVSEKEKAGLTAASRSSQGAVRGASQEDTERLSASTRRGNADAVTARISKIPWANK